MRVVEEYRSRVSCALLTTSGSGSHNENLVSAMSANDESELNVRQFG
jgi:hypothetical protein